MIGAHPFRVPGKLGFRFPKIAVMIGYFGSMLPHAVD
jgi:hypothetical protein